MSASVFARQRASAFAGVFSACLARAHLVGECVESTLAGLPPYSDTWPVHPRVAEELSWREARAPRRVRFSPPQDMKLGRATR